MKEENKKENKKETRKEKKGEMFNFLKDWTDLNPDPPVVRPDPPGEKEKK